MASFLTSSNLGSNVIVTKEEFFSFHNIDRQLFTRLVVGLGRDTSQSTHVMAFFMWLEKMSKDMRMVKNLLQWPDTMLDCLADEAALVLNCIESSHFPYDDEVNDKGLPLIQSIIRNTKVSLKYFHNNRMNVISGVTKLLNDVCLRAFTDIVQQVQYQKALREHNFQVANTYGSMAGPYVQQVVYYASPAGATVVPQQVVVPTLQSSEGSSSSRSEDNSRIDTYDVSNQKEFNRDFDEILAMMTRTNITTSNDEKKEVAVDDRIIFLTFSKGYPISEAEVREYFKRKYGDIIESIQMQDVVPPEQPLYARLVVRSEDANMIDRFLEGTPKVKLSINGKHVWARKYVRKDIKSLQEASLGTAEPPSPSSVGTSY